MLGLSKLETILILVLVVAASYIAVDLLARHHATQACEAKDTAAAVKQESKVAAEVAAAIPEVKREAEQLHETTSHPVTDAPHVRVCPAAKSPHPSEVLPAPTPGPEPDAAASLRIEDSPDIGAPLVTVGRDADAQIAALQSYVERVCHAVTPR